MRDTRLAVTNESSPHMYASLLLNDAPFASVCKQSAQAGFDASVCSTLRARRGVVLGAPHARAIQFRAHPQRGEPCMARCPWGAMHGPVAQPASAWRQAAELASLPQSTNAPCSCPSHRQRAPNHRRSGLCIAGSVLTRLHRHCAFAAALDRSEWAAAAVGASGANRDVPSAGGGESTSDALVGIRIDGHTNLLTPNLRGVLGAASGHVSRAVSAGMQAQDEPQHKCGAALPRPCCAVLCCAVGTEERRSRRSPDP